MVGPCVITAVAAGCIGPFARPRLELEERVAAIRVEYRKSIIFMHFKEE